MRRIIRVAVPHAPEDYEIVLDVGALDGLHALLPPAARYVILSDSNVAALHGERIQLQLLEAGVRADLITFSAGEGSKTRHAWMKLCDRMLQLGVGRDACVIALGGGVTGDLAGFVAATYMRGLPLVQAPTSVLAMIDAAVGGKVGLDVASGKNLVGAFHQPRLVVIDPLVLRTLPRDEIRNGLAEAVKHGAILDAAYFDWITDAAAGLLALDPPAVQRLVGRSLELKAGVVAEDPHERGRRAVLNFGHTIGHALEVSSDYALPHGFGVGVGMIVEARAGELTGLTERGTAERIAAALQQCELPTKLPRRAFDGPVEGVFEAARLDKKARDAVPRVVQLAGIGRCAAAGDGGWTHAVPRDVLLGALREVILDRGDV